MKGKFKKIAALVTTALMAVSALGGGAGLTAFGEDTVALRLWYGHKNKVTYTETHKLIEGINTINTLNQTASNGYTDAYYLGIANVGYMANGTDAEGTTAKGNGIRWAILPFEGIEKNGIDNTITAFNTDCPGGFADKYIRFDIAKGSSYSAIKKDYIDKIIIGLGYLNRSENRATNAYGTYIRYVDITNDMPEGNTTYSSAEGWKTVEYKVSDILNGTDFALHTATEAVTAANANCLVIGFIMKTGQESFTKGSQNILHYRDVKLISKSAPDVNAEAGESVANGNGTFKVGTVFEGINPSDYSNVVFKVGDDYYGNTVTDAFDGSLIDGTANIGVILEDAASPDVSVWFTNKELNYKSNIE